MTAPGIAWVLGSTIAAEVGDIGRFPSPKKLCGYTGLCPRGTSPAAATSAAHWPTTARRICAGP
jgi:transposase